jgi:hypothetical protein
MRAVVSTPAPGSASDNQPFDDLPIAIGEDRLTGDNHRDCESAAMTGRRREGCERDERASEDAPS